MRSLLDAALQHMSTQSEKTDASRPASLPDAPSELPKNDPSRPAADPPVPGGRHSDRHPRTGRFVSKGRVRVRGGKVMD